MRALLLGCRNAGKSTLFNRLAGKALAITSDVAGTTRDWREAPASLFDLSFVIIDSAGPEDTGPVIPEPALAGVDIILFMIDARAGLTEGDRDLAAWLRRRQFPVILLANKCEGQAGLAGEVEAASLGFPDMAAISARQGHGLDELCGLLRQRFPACAGAAGRNDTAAPPPVRLAIAGRPNTGKSSLVNRWMGFERVAVGPGPGLTRDPVALPFRFGGRMLRIVDTAGLSRRGPPAGTPGGKAANETERTIRLAQLVILVLDATAGVHSWDLTLLDRIRTTGRAIVIAANKWDLVRSRDSCLPELRQALSRGDPAGQPDIVPVSALTGEGTTRLLQVALETFDRWDTRISTSRVNNWLQEALRAHPPPGTGGKRPKVRYAAQIRSRPPTIALFAPAAEALPESYRRYLAGSFRKQFGLGGIPVRIVARNTRKPAPGEKTGKN